MSDRFPGAFEDAVDRVRERKRKYGLLGRHNASGHADGPVTFVVPGRKNFLFVTIRNANGAQTSVPARNDAGVAQSEDLSVEMRVENGTTWVIVGRSARDDLATVPATPPSGVPIHIHDDRYFREDEHVSTSAGAADAAKPIILGATGLLSNTFLDVELSSIAGLTSAADRLPYYTGLGTASLATFTAFARTFLDDADAVTVRATLGLIIGTNVQAFDATLLSLALLGTAADRIAYTTGVDTWAETPLTAFGRTLIDDAASSNARTTLGLVIGTDVQAQDAELAAIAGLTSAADRLPYFTGLGTAALATFTAFGRTLAALADAAAGRAALVLGTIATEAENLYALLAGRAGGQTLNGGTASGETLTLHGSAHATKGPVNLNPTSGAINAGTATQLDTTAMQLSSSVFTNAFFTTVAAAIGSRAELIHAWKVSDSDDFFALTNTSVTNARFGATFLFRNISANVETFNFAYETLVANDTGTEPAIVFAAYTRTAAQAFGALATRPIFAVRNLSTDLVKVMANGDVAIGAATPQGKLHIHDGTAGFLVVSKTAIVGAAQTIIPDAAGDVVRGAVVRGIAYNTTPGTAKVDTALIVPGGTADVVIGADTLRFAVSAGGALTVIRQAGTATWQFSGTVEWM